MRLLKKGVQIGVSVQLPIDIKAGLSRESLDLDAELTMWWPTQQGVQNKDGDERSPTLGQDGNTLVPQLSSVTAGGLPGKTRPQLKS